MSSSVRSPSPPARRCFVCGPDNPIGLHLTFRIEDGECRSEFTPNENHQGYPGVVHGGMIYAALDDVMANWLYLQGARAYTARCEIRYRHPAQEGERLLLAGRERSRRRALVEMEGRATRAADGRVIATATATFVMIDEEEFADGSEWGNRWGRGLAVGGVRLSGRPLEGSAGAQAGGPSG